MYLLLSCFERSICCEFELEIYNKFLEDCDPDLVGRDTCKTAKKNCLDNCVISDLDGTTPIPDFNRTFFLNCPINPLIKDDIFKTLLKRGGGCSSTCSNAGANFYGTKQCLNGNVDRVCQDMCTIKPPKEQSQYYKDCDAAEKTVENCQS